MMGNHSMEASNAAKISAHYKHEVYEKKAEPVVLEVEETVEDTKPEKCRNLDDERSKGRSCMVFKNNVEGLLFQ